MNDDDYYDAIAQRKMYAQEVAHMKQMMVMAQMNANSSSSTATASPAPRPARVKSCKKTHRLSEEDLKFLPKDMIVAMMRNRLVLRGYNYAKMLNLCEEVCNGFFYPDSDGGSNITIAFETEADQAKFILANEA